MVRFTSSVGKLRLVADTGCVQSARELLSRLEHENLVLTGELEQLRVLRSIVNRDPVPGLPSRVRFDRRLAEELSRASAGSGSSSSDSTSSGSASSGSASSGSEGSLLAVSASDVRPMSTPNRARRPRLQDPGAIEEVICGALRASDLCCRLEGDEFLILLPDTDLDEARLVMAAMKSAMIRAGSRHDAAIDMSIGRASWPTDSLVAAELVSRAERLMLADRLRLRRYSRRAPGQQRRMTTLAL